MNIIIPMAGAGSRFAKVGYTFPKPLISVHGDPMISVVVKNLNLKGSELISILNIEEGINPGDNIVVEIKYQSREIKKIKMLCRIDTKNELEYYKNGGILQYVLRQLAA